MSQVYEALNNKAVVPNLGVGTPLGFPGYGVAGDADG